jgi:hypothetical protein
VNVSADFGLIENDGVFTQSEFLQQLNDGLSIPQVSDAWNEALAAANGGKASANPNVPTSSGVDLLNGEFGLDAVPGLGGNIRLPIA